MIHVIISYKDNSSVKTSVMNEDVAKKYIDAIITVYRDDQLIEHIQKIETVDYLTKERKTVYPVVN